MVWIAVVIGALAALVAALAVVGRRLAPRHVATSAVTLRSMPQAAWDVVADFATWREWAPGVRSVERLPDLDGLPVWSLDSRHGAMPWQVVESAPPRRLVTRICDAKLPFGGTWTWAIDETPGGCRVTLTEDGEIRSPLLRAVARLLVGHHGTQTRFLRGLASRLGEDAAVERMT